MFHFCKILFLNIERNGCICNVTIIIRECILPLNLKRWGYRSGGNVQIFIMHNYFAPFSGNANSFHIGFDFFIQKAEGDTQTEMCRQFISNVIIPFQDELYRVFIFQDIDSTPTSRFFWYGPAYCSKGRQCILNMTFNDIEQFCSSCEKGYQCVIAAYF